MVGAVRGGAVPDVPARVRRRQRRPEEEDRAKGLGM